MKSLMLVAALLFVGGDREKGLQLYREGRFAEAAAAFRSAIASEGDSPELQYNLALASWRAGELAAAETAAEKYAASSADARVELHRGLLGAVRHDEAKALEAKADAAEKAPPAPGAEPQDPLPLLEQALAKAEQARDHFVAGAAGQPSPELLRNTERTLRYVDALQKRIDELKKQREEQKKDDEQKDDDQKDDEKDDQKQDDKKDDKKQGSKDDKPKDDKQQPSDEPQKGDGEQKPEPKPEPKDGSDGEQPPQPQPEPDEGERKPRSEKPRTDAPGEASEQKELTPEQTQRLLEQMKELDKKLQALRARAKSGRPPVERDW